MNIFGEGFPKEIINQVTYRQKAYGSGYSGASSRTHEQILYLNGNSSWCRLMSGVDIKNIDLVNNPSIQNLNRQENILGSKLAKKFILFNGTSEYKGGLTYQREGINTINSLSGENSVYGIGGTEFGIRPMMGIISATINHENRGSLRRAQVKIKAWNRVQFEIVDILYLRLGFSILLEWGNSMYYDNNGILQTNVNNSLDSAFFNVNTTVGVGGYDDMLNRIYKQRLATGGNYDAMIGKVSNFHWSFMPDGSYDIVVDIVSIGDVIESLKINTLSNNIVPTLIQNVNPKEYQDLEAEELIDLFAFKHDIGGFLSSIKTKTFTSQDTYSFYSNIKEGDIYITNTFSPEAQKILSNYPDFLVDYNSKKPGETIEIEITNDTTGTVQNVLLAAYYLGAQIPGVAGLTSQASYSNILTKNKITFTKGSSNDPFKDSITSSQISKDQFIISDRDVIRVDWKGDLGTQWYLRLGYFLEFIQNNLIIKTSNNSSLLSIDYNKDSNVMFLESLQISVDPRVCVVNRELLLQLDDGSTEIYPFVPAGDSFIQNELTTAIKNTTYGDIMNIYLNFTYILLKIEELKDDKGKVKLIDFLQGLLQGINGALGGINDLDVFIDEPTNTIKIIDKNPLPNLDSVLAFFGKSNTPAFFDLYGYSKRELDENNPVYNGEWHSSFIREFSFTTELTPEFSTMITVGAAANGVVVGENDTVLSKLNKGLEDRFKPIVYNIKNIIEEKLQLKQEFEKQLTLLNQKYNEIYKQYVTFLIDLSDYSTDIEEIDAYKDTLTNLIQIKLQIQKIKDQLYSLDNPKAQQKNSPGTGFIPFNLSLTMDGLSGMKINQQFTIDASYLPLNYPDTVKFLIKNMTHTIQNNKWITKLDSYCIASGIYEEENLVTVESNEFIGPVNPPNATPNPDWSKYKPANTFGGTLRLNQAVKDQSTYVYSKGIYAPSKGLKTPMGYGEVAGYCAGYTYNIAYKLKEYIDTNSSSPITFTYQKAGNANANQHRANIQALGIYDMYYLGDYTAKELSNNFFNKYSWNIGDIVNYYAPNDSPESNMHSQIYTGNIWTSSTWTNSKGEKRSAGNSKWSTSTATNYGSSFVYDPSNIVFKVYAFKVIPSYLV